VESRVDSTRDRRLEGIVLCVAIAWQVWVASSAFHRGPMLGTYWEELGAEVSVVSTTFVATCRLWLLVPLISLVAAGDLVRRERASVLHRSLVIGFVVAAPMFLQMWMVEGAMQPFFSLIEKLG
jgi:hypothetical protein